MSTARAVDVVCGGPGREAAVSRTSGAAIVAGLQAQGVDVVGVDCDGELDLDRLRPDSVVFNIIHGTYGEDGTLQQHLADAGRVFVGSDAAASRTCMDKVVTKRLAAEAGVPVPWGKAIDPRHPADPALLKVPHGGPLVLKPACDGSSVGLHLLPSVSFLLPAIEETVRDLGPVPLVVEERLPGPEYTVGIIDEPDGSQRVLQPLSIIPAGEDAYDYEAKYVRNDTRYEFVEDETLATVMQDHARTVYQACGCRDLARVDFIADHDGRPTLLEVNTLPGFTDHSLLPKAAARAGLDFAALCQHLVTVAATRLQRGTHA